MAIDASKFPPKNTTELLAGEVGATPGPALFEAVAGDADAIVEDLPVGETTELLGGLEVPQAIIMVNGVNLVDILADLTTRVETLEP